MKALINFLFNREPEAVVADITAPTPDFTRPMTIIETSEEEENDDNN